VSTVQTLLTLHWPYLQAVWD